MLLPDGTTFPFWDDRTEYSRAWHVDPSHAEADDEAGVGSEDQPLQTLSRACELVQAGECVVVHAGVYRETLRPQRGGDGADAMIGFFAAPGDKVVLSASDLWSPDWQAATRIDRAGRCWAAGLPMDSFGGYNPFAMSNLSRSQWFPWAERPAAERERMLQRRGMVFQDGQPLQQVQLAKDVTREPGRFWVDDSGEKVLLRPFDDADPLDVTWEISVRRQCLAPSIRGLGWIRVAGFEVCHAANGLIPPQYGAISTTSGHHWIIEDCQLHHINAVGMDIGLGGEPELTERPCTGNDHIVRRNDFWDIGLGGLCGTLGTHRCLIEANRFQRIGTLHIEHLYEAAAIKVHHARRSLIRWNRIEHLVDACGIWIDYQCGDNRLFGNCIRNVKSVLAGIYIEANHSPHLVDGNLVLDCDDVEGNDPPKDGMPGGLGISSDVSDHTWIHHNLVARIRGHFAIACHMAQGPRHSGGQSSVCCGHQIGGNLVVQARKRIFLHRRNDNVSERNGFDEPAFFRQPEQEEGAHIPSPIHPQRGYFTLREADRDPEYGLDVWQRLVGFDQGSVGLPLRLVHVGEGVDERDQWYLESTGAIDEELPQATHDDYQALGPLSPAQWETLAAGGQVAVRDLFGGPPPWNPPAVAAPTDAGKAG